MSKKTTLAKSKDFLPKSSSMFANVWKNKFRLTVSKKITLVKSKNFLPKSNPMFANVWKSKFRLTIFLLIAFSSN